MKKGVLGEKRGKASEIAGKWCFFLGGVSEAKETHTSKNKNPQNRNKSIGATAAATRRCARTTINNNQQQSTTINNNQQQSTTKQTTNEEQINHNISKTEATTIEYINNNKS